MPLASNSPVVPSRDVRVETLLEQRVDELPGPGLKVDRQHARLVERRDVRASVGVEVVADEFDEHERLAFRERDVELQLGRRLAHRGDEQIIPVLLIGLDGDLDIAVRRHLKVAEPRHHDPLGDPGGRRIEQFERRATRRKLPLMPSESNTAVGVTLGDDREQGRRRRRGVELESDRGERVDVDRLDGERALAREDEFVEAIGDADRRVDPRLAALRLLAGRVNQSEQAATTEATDVVADANGVGL